MINRLSPFAHHSALFTFTAVIAFAPLSAAYAQAVDGDASALFDQGEAAMKVQSYDDALVHFGDILKRFPGTDFRYKAQFRMADALVAEKKEGDAMALLQSIVQEASPDWSPQALEKIGDIDASDQKYTEAFRAYRQIILDYPESPAVDHAYFDIGATHFKLGHFELAAQQLALVGTAYAIRNPQLQKVSPGQPLTVKLTEPNVVAGKGDALDVTVAATSGDKETVELTPDIENGDRFTGVIDTRLGAAAPGDKVLELHGGDKVTLTYLSRYVGGGAVQKTITMPVASNGRVAILDSSGAEVGGVVLSDTITLQVTDADRDISDQPDILKVAVTTRKGDSETVTLTETGQHTGIFQAVIPTIFGAPTAEDGKIESNAPLAEGSAALDDKLIVSYSDELNLVNPDGTAHVVKINVPLYPPGTGIANVPRHDIDDASVDIKARLLRGQSLNQIAETYRDLGATEKASMAFAQAADIFRELIRQYPAAPEVQDALFGLFDNYVGQDQYESAIGIIAQISRQYPQSARASEALFKLAELHASREEYDHALAIYQSIVQREHGTQMAQDAQYAICTTYVAMFKPQRKTLGKPAVTREEVEESFDDFAKAYPTSDHAADALSKLTRFRYDGGDFPGTVEAAKRMAALFPDNVLTGPVLILEGEAQQRQGDTEDARIIYADIIANYGSEADDATKLLSDLNAVSGAAKTGATK